MIKHQNLKDKTKKKYMKRIKVTFISKLTDGNMVKP